MISFNSVRLDFSEGPSAASVVLGALFSSVASGLNLSKVSLLVTCMTYF